MPGSAPAAAGEGSAQTWLHQVPGARTRLQRVLPELSRVGAQTAEHPGDGIGQGQGQYHWPLAALRDAPIAMLRAAGFHLAVAPPSRRRDCPSDAVETDGTTGIARRTVRADAVVQGGLRGWT